MQCEDERADRFFNCIFCIDKRNCISTIGQTRRVVSDDLIAVGHFVYFQWACFSLSPFPFSLPRLPPRPYDTGIPTRDITIGQFLIDKLRDAYVVLSLLW